MHHKHTWGLAWRWAMLNTVGLSLGILARQFAFQVEVPGYRLLIEGIVLGLVMALIQTYAFNQYGRPHQAWFWLSWLGWAIGWAYGWSWGWRIFGGQGLNVVMLARGGLTGGLVGGLQWLNLRQRSNRAGLWVFVNLIGWAVGFWLVMKVGGAFAWILGGGVASLMTGLALSWICGGDGTNRGNQSGG